MNRIKKFLSNPDNVDQIFYHAFKWLIDIIFLVAMYFFFMWIFPEDYKDMVYLVVIAAALFRS